MRDVIIIDNQDITCLGMETLAKQSQKASSIFIINNKADLVKSLISKQEAVIILDYSLSDFSSIDELLNVGYRFPKVNWLLFSDELSTDFLKQIVINSEAYSVVLKSCELDEINIALSHTFKGERFICGRATNQLLQIQKPVTDSLDNLLTNTEKEILKEIALGRTTKEIASLRNLSFHTINSHRKNIFRKLDVNNVHEATKYAMRAGLVDLAEYYI